MQHAGTPADERCGVLAGLDPLTRRFDPDQRDVPVVDERGEDAYRVRASADTCHDDVGKLAVERQVLLARLVTDHALQVADHLRIRVRTDGRSDDVVGRADVGDPVSDGFGGRVLERLRPARHLDHLRSEQLHASHVHRLAPHVLGTHVDRAVESEPGAYGRGRNPMLAGPGLGDDALLAHAQREQGLADRIVQLVRSGVAEVLALEMDAGAAEVLAQARGRVEGGRPADEGAPVAGKLELKLRIGLGFVPHVLELVERAHQRLGDVLAAEGSEPSVDGMRQRGARHQDAASASRTARTKARTLSGSLTLGRASTPLETSTP